MLGFCVRCRWDEGGDGCQGRDHVVPGAGMRGADRQFHAWVRQFAFQSGCGFADPFDKVFDPIVVTDQNRVTREGLHGLGQVFDCGIERVGQLMCHEF
ncbi:hypothetical protein SPAR_36236 [Streptomyces sparsogenes DSM 40356]|uniref:Uncharacterized protein n=1 Tax=Streptomyces sparsogenes DSM 40356 TaxID=1331668 RepID=A0A1R1S8B5_9ACTN|nr:hypothetical protein SPAR_36236 [Streptomyces sparsogenes DSM 40356]